MSKTITVPKDERNYHIKSLMKLARMTRDNRRFQMMEAKA